MRPSDQKNQPFEEPPLSEIPGISRMHVAGMEATNDDIVWQELALYKVPTQIIAEKVVVERLLREHGARAVAIRSDYTVFEVTGHREETDKFVKVLEPFGLIEFVRSARVAIIKGSHDFHERLREFEEAEPGESTAINEFLGEQESVFSM